MHAGCPGCPCAAQSAPVVRLFNAVFQFVLLFAYLLFFTGDLIPLSYVTLALTGHSAHATLVNTDTGEQLSAPAVWQRLLNTTNPIEYVHELQPKEGLGLVNGTAFSCAHCALVLHDAEDALTLGAVATAMMFLCMNGNTERYCI